MRICVNLLLLVGVHFYLLFMISFGAEIAVRIDRMRLQRLEIFPFLK
jgi:hypothetical protein